MIYHKPFENSCTYSTLQSNTIIKLNIIYTLKIEQQLRKENVYHLNLRKENVYKLDLRKFIDQKSSFFFLKKKIVYWYNINPKSSRKLKMEV